MKRLADGGGGGEERGSMSLSLGSTINLNSPRGS
jgi:hypothetical protein